jgi:hypothetical protein
MKELLNPSGQAAENRYMSNIPIGNMSKRKETDLPITWSMTLDSVRVIGVPKSRHCQSSASPRKSGIWIAGGADPP